ncbi:DUF3693 domain-containing protein [Burkholderia perseverans]|uniref:DUF3693 domain-containing protein n=1 Tax=Burkholderia perseverans TaxID=2615214 RepID=UPI001FED2D76|nr:DUF3693 domain-containing protein [Burkholderia perseverans]
MKTTVDYLDAIKARLDLPSDYAVAKALHLTRAAVSKQRLGHSAFDETTALRVADILGLDPMEVIASAHIERARDEETRRLWERALGKVTGAAATAAFAAVIITAASPSPAKASALSFAPGLYLMSNCESGERSS